ncbi:MAG TPA: integrase family protein [Aquabacterium sp.]|nr:integrase family protein [Aquabacterium sp.]HQC98240.1 integrase family protein [Aquabacterium sp.]
MPKIAFTAGRVTKFSCPPGKAQAFLWDSTSPGLGLRSTPSGRPAYIFQGRFQGQTLRLTIGSPDAWTIPQAQEKARELQRNIDEGRDPREVKAQATAADVAKRADDRRQALTAREAWNAYLLDRAPHWGERHRQDHVDKAVTSDDLNKRGKPLKPGPLAPLLALPLRDLDSATIDAWAAKESKARPTAARLSLRLLKAFLGWCADQTDYAGVLPSTNPAKSKKARESLGRPGVKSDALQREQLPAWFSAVRGLPNPTVSAYLQTLLLTGARPGEVLAMQWTDLDTKWKGLTIRDKVEGQRVIPLTPHVAALLAALPRRNEMVFSGERAELMARPHRFHEAACKAAGLDGLTLHGLRRSFKSLTEWLDVPAGVVAQIMGHRPSATAEKHYTVRPLDLLRVHHERIEAWILAQAGVSIDAAQSAKMGDTE